MKFPTQSIRTAVQPLLIILCMTGLVVAYNAPTIFKNAALVQAEPEPVPDQPLVEELPRDLGEKVTTKPAFIDPDGNLSGRFSLFMTATGGVIPPGEVIVHLVDDGLALQSVRLDPLGGFVFKDVETGVYGIVAIGPQAFAAFSVYAVTPEPGVVYDAEKHANEFKLASYQATQSKPVAQTEDGFEIDAVGVPKIDFPAILDVASIYLPEAFAPDVASTSRQETRVKTVSAVLQPELPEAEMQVGGTVATPTDHLVYLNQEGDLQGVIRAIDPNTLRRMRIRRTNAFLMQNGQIIDQTRVAEDGSFKFQSTPTGVYSFTVAGASGFGAIAVDVRLEPSQGIASADSPEQAIRLVNANLQGENQFSMSPLTGANAGFGSQVLDNFVNSDGEGEGEEGEEEGEGEAENTGGQGGDSGGSGGGAAGGGDGLLGALGAGLGAAALAAALADDDDASP